jgi:hypothetical protein
MGAFITAEEIQAGIPEPYRCYFLASAANNLTPEALPVVAAFWEAVKQKGQSVSITDWVCRGTHRFDIFVPVVLCCFIHWCRFTLAVL